MLGYGNIKDLHPTKPSAFGMADAMQEGNVITPEIKDKIQQFVNAQPDDTLSEILKEIDQNQKYTINGIEVPSSYKGGVAHRVRDMINDRRNKIKTNNPVMNGGKRRTRRRRRRRRQKSYVKV
jgi:hypothetical protein